MAASTMSTSSLLSARAPVVAGRKTSSRTARAVRVFASQDKQAQNQAPKDAILKTFGAIAAAQLAFSGAALADLIPESAKSGSARAEVNEKTSNLPSFGDVGRSLQKNFGTNDPKDVGRAIEQNTPNAPDLTKNPKDIGKDIVGGAKNLVGDLSLDSGLPNPRTAANELKQGANKLGNKADKLGNDVGSAASNLSGNPAQQAINKAKSVGSDIKKAGNQAVSNLSDLSDLNPFKSPGGEADKLPVPTAGDVKDAADKVNLPNIPNPFKGDGGDIAKQLDKAPVPTASDVKNAGDSVKDSIGGFQIPKNS